MQHIPSYFMRNNTYTHASPSFPEYTALDCPLSANDIFICWFRNAKDNSCVIDMVIFLIRDQLVSIKLIGSWRLGER